MHLADAFIQSDLHCIQVTVSTFYQLLLSLGIEPMILALLAPCSTSWATGKLYQAFPQAQLDIYFRVTCSLNTEYKQTVFISAIGRLAPFCLSVLHLIKISSLQLVTLYIICIYILGLLL